MSSFIKNISSKKSRQEILIAIILAIISISTTAFLLLTHKEAETNSPIPIVSTTKSVKQEIIVSVEMPITLVIPEIGVNAKIIYVGLMVDGTMEIPPDQDTVAWYQFGPRPGEIGSSVIAGHYGWFDGKGSVFNNLHDLAIGDEIQIIDSAGISTTFMVRESQKYNPDADASDIFGSNDGKAHLNLITCDGTWINSENTYSDRLVIFTDKKEL